MKLSTQLAPDFTSTIRVRGLEYHRNGLVRVVLMNRTEFEAVVTGSRAYLTRITFEEEDSDVYLSCECASFESTGRCKHLWATVVEAEQRNFLSGKTILDVWEGDVPLLDFGPAGVERTPKPPKPPLWQERLTIIGRTEPGTFRQPGPARRRIVYRIDVAASMAGPDLVVNFGSADVKQDGAWSSVKELRLTRAQIATLRDNEDRQILALLCGGKQHYGYSYETLPRSFQVAGPLARTLLPLIAGTGRCFLKLNTPGPDLPLTWDENGPWSFGLEMRRQDSGGWMVCGTLRRGEERMDLADSVLISAGLVFTRERVAPLDETASIQWISSLRKSGCIEASEEDGEKLLAALLTHPGAPAVEVPEELRVEEVTVTPQPCLRLKSNKPSASAPQRLQAELSFDYQGRRVLDIERSRGFFEAESRRFIPRDPKAEADADERLYALGFKRPIPSYGPPVWELAPKKLPAVARALIQEGWHIEADGKTFRRPGAFRLNVASGVDWFELQGEVEYGETSARLPELLEALRRGEKMVRLSDGTYGVLPEEWLARFGSLAGMGEREDGHMRFRRNQAGLLDALLAAQPEIRCDEAFTRVRQELRQFDGVKPAEQPAGFTGDLRQYQREGLGWMHFLRQFGFGGCLADDMGVGKTVQVLALLESRRELRAQAADSSPGPSLVVVPKSLVFNWKREAARFAPALRVLDYTGLARQENSFDGYDIVLTTYGTLRRDVLRFKDVAFDYIVLDEAQAIKNKETESAKAVRLLRGGNRLAMSGTPVENHLGELWSLFEFLNPGMLGSAGVFQLAGGLTRDPSEETLQLLCQALRPFILRRTKEQVASELPAKTEQTVYCEMEPAQRKLYNELRAHYRDVLLSRVETDGLAKSKIHVLEALLRLRQAACHPGLLDPKRAGEPSAKLDVLRQRLAEVLDEGHTALVFSQFTSLLDIVRKRLDSDGLTYEYLDGATRDREARVERFQSGNGCRLFLISLKAGGLGLNLTAADYVFLLDPWWNPAVEAQAVDRTHRIGQERQVFAYRLIARDTVEEKVLELQESKRNLAAAIIGGGNSLIRDLKREDLELLLS